jgi:hypothetical protein
MKISGAILVFVTLLFVGASQASQVEIGAVPIALGMERAAVAEQMRRYRAVSVVGDDTMVFYYNGKTLLGGVGFAKGRVVWASRSRGAFSDDESPLMAGKALVQAIAEMTARSGDKAVISASNRGGSGSEWNIAEAVFPDRTLRVTVQMTSERLNTLYLDEFVGRKP